MVYNIETMDANNSQITKRCEKCGHDKEVQNNGELICVFCNQAHDNDRCEKIGCTKKATYVFEVMNSNWGIMHLCDKHFEEWADKQNREMELKFHNKDGEFKTSLETKDAIDQWDTNYSPKVKA